jgi:hypothetical protein
VFEYIDGADFGLFSELLSTSRHIAAKILPIVRNRLKLLSQPVVKKKTGHGFFLESVEFQSLNGTPIHPSVRKLSVYLGDGYTGYERINALLAVFRRMIMSALDLRSIISLWYIADLYYSSSSVVNDSKKCHRAVPRFLAHFRPLLKDCDTSSIEYPF